MQEDRPAVQDLEDGRWKREEGRAPFRKNSGAQVKIVLRSGLGRRKDRTGFDTSTKRTIIF
jgi:hypothetical protein